MIPITCWRAAKSGRSVCRSRILATCGPCSTAFRSRQMNTSMTINATAPWLMALYMAVADEQGAPREALQGTTQNDIMKEYLSRGTYIFPPLPRCELTRDLDLFTARESAEMEPDERLLLSSAGSRRDAGAGTGFALATAIAVLDGVKADIERRRRKPFRRSGRAHIVLRERGHALRHGDLQDARLHRCGTKSRATATASRTRSAGASAMACRSILLGSPSSSPRTTSIASSSRCWGWCCPSTRVRAQYNCPRGTKRSACLAPSTSNGPCGRSRSWPSKPTFSISPIFRRGSQEVDAQGRGTQEPKQRAELTRNRKTSVGPSRPLKSGYLKARTRQIKHAARLEAIETRRPRLSLA